MITVPTEPLGRNQRDSVIEFSRRVRRVTEPEALLKWYFPDRMTGHEFLLFREARKGIARDGKPRHGNSTSSLESIGESAVTALIYWGVLRIRQRGRKRKWAVQNNRTALIFSATRTSVVL